MKGEPEHPARLADKQMQDRLDKTARALCMELQTIMEAARKIVDALLNAEPEGGVNRMEHNLGRVAFVGAVAGAAECVTDGAGWLLLAVWVLWLYIYNRATL